jgi:hypothetical protein
LTTIDKKKSIETFPSDVANIFQPDPMNIHCQKKIGQFRDLPKLYFLVSDFYNSLCNKPQCNTINLGQKKAEWFYDFILCCNKKAM